MKSDMSILGLYNYDSTLFANMAYPEDFTSDDKAVLLNNLLMELAEFEVIYPTPVFMKQAIGAWSAKELPTWERIYAAAKEEYNPIENYDRQESITEVTDGERQHSGSDTSTHSGSDTETNSGSDTETNSGNDVNAATGNDVNTNKIAAFDSATLVTHDESTLAHGQTNTLTHGHVLTTAHGHVVTTDHGHVITDSHGEKIEDDVTVTRSGRVHGNIGVTTSQQMLQQELDIAPKLNITNIIIDSFKNRFCLLVY